MYNRIILAGRLGADPERFATQSGKDLVKFSLATDGGKKDTTDWHAVIAFDRLGDTVMEHLRKGSAVIVDGRLSYNAWTDKQGRRQKTATIVASTVRFLDRRGDAQGDGKQRATGDADGPEVGRYEGEAPTLDEIPF